MVCKSRQLPDCCGWTCFFGAILSVVTQFDLCPMGGYNGQTELLRRTGVFFKRTEHTAATNEIEPDKTYLCNSYSHAMRSGIPLKFADAQHGGQDCGASCTGAIQEQLAEMSWRCPSRLHERSAVGS